METPPVMPAPEQPRKNNTPLIIGVVAAVVLCCCCVTLALLWQFGDAIIQSLGF
jgi:hypothetical protein